MKGLLRARNGAAEVRRGQFSPGSGAGKGEDELPWPSRYVRPGLCDLAMRRVTLEVDTGMGDRRGTPVRACFVPVLGKNLEREQEEY